MTDKKEMHLRKHERLQQGKSRSFVALTAPARLVLPPDDKSRGLSVVAKGTPFQADS
jgi:hypothetical protein